MYAASVQPVLCSTTRTPLAVKPRVHLAGPLPSSGRDGGGASAFAEFLASLWAFGGAKDPGLSSQDYQSGGGAGAHWECSFHSCHPRLVTQRQTGPRAPSARSRPPHTQGLRRIKRPPGGEGQVVAGGGDGGHPRDAPDTSELMRAVTASACAPPVPGSTLGT